MADPIPTTYLYKAYTITGDYLGLLENVSSDFSYNQEINTGGASLDIEIANAFSDVGATLSEELLVDHTGDEIIDELGNDIAVSQEFVFDNVPMSVGNRITVFEFNKYHPNGLQVFDGFVFTWATDHIENKLTIKVLSFGALLDNYIIKTGLTIEIEQESVSADNDFYISYAENASNSNYHQTYIYQSFQPGSDFALTKIAVKLSAAGGQADRRATLNLYAGTPDDEGELLGTVTVDTTGLTGTPQLVEFVFGTPINVLNGDDYFFRLESVHKETDGSFGPGPGDTTVTRAPFFVSYNYPSAYAGGKAWFFNQDTGLTAFDDNYDLVFTIYSTAGNVLSPYTNSDPSNILRDIIDNFISQGGLVNYTEESIDDVGGSVNHTFNLNTFLEGIRLLFDIAGANFYWYVDPGSNTLYFKQTPSTPDHTLLQGNHITNLNISQSLAGMRNSIYFSGGDDGSGDNIFRLNSNAASILNYGQWLGRTSNNRVTDNDTADLISIGELSRYSNPSFICTVVVPADVYDISSFAIGQLVGFGNFGNLIDSLQLQIVGKVPQPGQVELRLGTIIQRSTKFFDELNRRLINIETIDNPDAPS